MASYQMARLLGARICHDLITPIGAISLGLEALEDAHDPSMMSAIKESIQRAASRLNLIRFLCSDDSSRHHVSIGEIRKLAQDYLGSERVQGHIEAAPGQQQILTSLGQLSLHAMCIAATGLLRGGELHASFYQTEAAGVSSEGRYALRIRATGPMVGPPEEAISILKNGPRESLTPRTVFAAMAYSLMMRLQMTAQSQVTPSELIIEIA